MNSDTIDLSSDLEEPSDRHDQSARSPSIPFTHIPLTPSSTDMDDWPEDESQMTVRGSVADFTWPCLSAIVIPDDSTSIPDSPSEPHSPTTSEWGLMDNALRESEEGQSAKTKPSLEYLRRLLHVFNPNPDDSSNTPSSVTLENSSSPSEDTEISVPGSSPDKPIDLSENEDCVLSAQIERRISTVWDPRRRLVPRSTLVGEIEEAVLHTGETIRPSSTVKLASGMFLRIEWITLREGEIYLWGRHLMGHRNPHWPRYIPKNEHELIWRPWMDHDNSFTSSERHVPVSLMEVTGLCVVIFTNVRPGKNWENPPDSGLPDSGLFCRLKVTKRKRPKVSMGRSRALQPSSTPEWDRSVEYLTLEECDEGYGFESYDLRDRYRGCRTVSFGEGQIRSSSYPTITIDENEDEDDSQFNQDSSRPVVDLTVDLTAYTFGDAYCGAGGTSCGAKQAGLEIKWACDMDRFAVETYGLNFPSAWIEFCSFSDLLTHPKENLQVDIAHCSPPCQTFSPAHTINCDRDDSNSACIFSAGNLVEHATPRILTMEETSGLKERYKEFLYRVIMDLIEAGYSVRWTVIDVLHYGVPQTRKRLIIIAAGPGETLPPFPEITHDLPGSGCKPLVTINDTINHIPDNAPNHDVQLLLHRWRRDWRLPYDGRQLAKTLTCSGGEGNYHPSGWRCFTGREVACLQTFPMDFQFSNTNVRKQVGNAVPPALAKAMYEQIIATLRETDARELELKEERERERERERVGGPVERDGSSHGYSD